jgi:O-acetylserine/cysteine efflux transporter
LSVRRGPRLRTAFLVLLMVNLMWGGSLPATKLGLAEFSPFLLSWLRLTVSAVLFVAVLLRTGELRPLSFRDWVNLLALGLIGYCGTIGLQTLGTDGTTGASATVLGSTGPLFIAVCALVLLRERPCWGATAGLLVALLGIALVMGLGLQDATGMAGEQLRGNLLVLGSSACFGLFTVVGKSTMKRHSPMVVSGVACLGGALGLALPAALEISAGLPQVSLMGLMVVLYLGILVTFAGMIGWFWALQAVPASRGGAFLFVQPVSGVALAALLLGDLLSPSFLLGAALVLGGLYLIARD